MKAGRQVIDTPVIVLVGPTAVGKTELSFRLVERFDCEIISMDSMQVYRYMDIGTAKPSQEEQGRAPHHLIDIIDPDEQYDAARFVADCLQAMDEIAGRGKAVLLTGGTGLYLKALTEGLFEAMPADRGIRKKLQQRLDDEGCDALHKELCRIDPDTGRRVHKNDSQRLLRGLEIFYTSGRTWSELLSEQQEAERSIHFQRICQVALACEREEIYKRIALRTKIMLENGLVEEVERLLSMGYAPELSSMQSIGYRHVNNFINRTWDKKTMIEQLVQDTRRYAKRQMTWFGRNKELRWIHRDDQDGVIALVEENLDV